MPRIKSFYERATKLDPLKDSVKPSYREVSLVLKAIKDDAFERYFFHDLMNPTWVKLLREAGYFETPPGSAETSEHRTTYYLWPASMYLNRVADQVPAEVIRIILSIETDNPTIQSDLIEAVQKLPTSYSSLAVSIFDTWLDSGAKVSPIYDSVAIKLIDLLAHLVEIQDWEVALRLLQVLAKPLIPRNPEDYRYIPAVPRYGDSWFRHVLDTSKSLINARPLDVLEVLRPQLMQMIVLYYSSNPYWRRAVERHEQNHTFRGSYPHLLFETILDLTEYLAKNEPNKIRSRLIADLRHEYVIFRRLAIHIARLFPTTYPELISELLDERTYFDDLNVDHEYFLMLKELFPKLTKKQQSKILDWIAEGPLDEHRENKEQITAWQQRRLSIIWGGLPKELSNRFEDIDKHPFQESDLFLSYFSEGAVWSSNESPKTEQELEVLDMDELVAYLKELNDEDDDVKGGLGQTLSLVIARNPTKFATNAISFADLHLTFLYYLISGLEAAWKSGKQFDWGPIFEFLEYIVLVRNIPVQVGGYSFAQGSIFGQISSLLQTGVQNDEHAIPAAYLPRVRNLLVSILNKKEDPRDTNWATQNNDPISDSLNTEHAKAVEAVLSYALHYSRTQLPKPKSKGPFPRGNRMEVAIRQLLTDLLDPLREPNPAVRVWYGGYLAQLMYLDQTWVKAVLPQIFSDRPDEEIFWKAAWEGYLFHSRYLYEELYELLRPQYLRAVERLFNKNGERSRHTSDVSQRLAQHLAILYLRGIESPNDESGLLAQFLAVATDEQRAEIVQFLFREFNNSKENEKHRLWRRLKYYWKARAKVFSETEAPETFASEIQSFTDFLEFTPDNFKNIFHLVEAITVPQKDEWWGAENILDYIYRQKDEYTILTGRILLLLVSRLGWRLQFISQGRVNTILETLISSKIQQSAKLASQIINQFGELGVFDYMSLLYPSNSRIVHGSS